REISLKFHTLGSMKRRGFIKGAFGLAVGAGSSGSALAQIMPDPAPASETAQTSYSDFEKIITHTAKDTDVLCMLDENHGDVSLRSPLTDRRVLETARKAGYKNIQLEMPKDAAAIAEKYMRGEATREQFKNFALKELDRHVAENPLRYNKQEKADYASYLNAYNDSILDVMDTAHDTGIKVHFPDTMTTRQHMALGEKLKDSVKNGDTELSLLERERLKDDPLIADKIAAEDGKTIVMYGALHFFQKSPSNIDDGLEARGLRTTKVLMTNSALTVHMIEKFVEIRAEKSDAATEQIGARLKQMGFADNVKDLDVPNFTYQVHKNQAAQHTDRFQPPPSDKSPAQNPGVKALPTQPRNGG
ncbi:MAG TPA: hypothetical protein VGE32_08325, partial [Cellvibrio sp.]